jgi:hypothetical protein
MKSDNKQRSRSNSLSKLNEEVDQLISSEKKKSEENQNFLKKILGEEEDFNYNKIPNDIDKKILEMAEIRDFNLANSKKNKTKKMGLDLLNEQLEELIKKNINESKTETIGTDSISKNSHNKKIKKKLAKNKIDFDEDYDAFFENNNNSITFFNNSDSINNYEKYSNLNYDSSFSYGDEKELMEFINRKTCRKNNFEKYKEEYLKKNKYNNKNQIINLDSDDENSEDIKENQELNNNKKEKKHLKRLKKNTDNKEMKLALDAECIICTCIIKELANPDGCNHDFCKSCLIEWSQRSSKCPMCKTLYNNIFYYDNGIKKQISVTEIKSKYRKHLNGSENNEESDDEINIDEGCYICNKNTDPSKLLVCDRCKEKYCHYYCINLNKIPEGKWYCSYCTEEIKEIRMNRKRAGHYIL